MKEEETRSAPAWFGISKAPDVPQRTLSVVAPDTLSIDDRTSVSSAAVGQEDVEAERQASRVDQQQQRQAPLLQQLMGAAADKTRLKDITKFVNLMVQAKTFHVSAIKRRMALLWEEEEREEDDGGRAEGQQEEDERREGEYYPTRASRRAREQPKRNSLVVEEMFEAELCTSGKDELPPGSHPFQVSVMDSFHVSACAKCSESGMVSDGCYYNMLRRTITHGFNPPYETSIEQEYKSSGNNKLSKVFQGAFDESVSKMVREGVLRQLTEDSGVELRFINPMGMVLKNSDKARAKVLTGVQIVDQATLEQANDALAKLRPEPGKLVKTRLSMNYTANGGNRALKKGRFSYASSSDATFLMKRNSFMGKGDVQRYFLNFPLARESYEYFGVEALKLRFFFVMVFFGLACAPYFTSVWGAEFRKWVLSQHPEVQAVHFVDDWWVCADTLERTKAHMAFIVAILVAIGLTMAEDKFEYGQRLVFLGILYDTVAMTMAFDEVQCQVVATMLRDFRVKLLAGRAISYTERVQLCGKLNWFGEILQSGRVHTAAWWRYSTLPTSVTPGEELRARLLVDTDWWLAVLDKWANKEHSEKVFPILSAHELLADPEGVGICCSDMSGPDGYGCHYGTIAEMEGDPFYSSVRWPDGFVPHSSMWGELKALREYLELPNRRGKLVVWISDSLSGVWCINKGRAHSGEEMALVAEILERCDELSIALVALWVPREENQYADYLSHLAALMHRDSMAGRCSDLDRENRGD